MIYYARLKDGESKVHIQKDGQDYSCSIDDEVFVADARLIDGPTAISLIVNRKCYEVMVTRSGRSFTVSTGGDEFEIELFDELERRSQAAGSDLADSGAEEIKAPMPGVVVSVEVARGDKVEAGTPVVIVEAMKMQNELATLAGGTVRDILVKAGDVVESRQTLLVIDRGEE
ncbi:MAG: acetyl-CoA carboxylase biotin carboxyl carrier protein subunit [bacterium]|jgi:biotin carboxyl carrier protein